MPSATLLAGAFMTLAEASGYVLVGWLLQRRPAADGTRRAAGMFVAWWYAIGLNKALAALSGLGAMYGLIGVDVYTSVLYVNYVILVVSLWCLLYYLAFLRTGSERLMLPISLLYGAYYLLLMYNTIETRPASIGLGTWRTFLISETQAPEWRRLVTLAILVLPQTIASIAGLTLVRRLPERTQRYRLRLVCLSILAWTMSILLVALPQFAESGNMQVASRIVGLAAAAACVAAYRPPGWMQRWLGVRAVQAATRAG